MKRHLVLPVIAAGLLVFAVGYALYVQHPEPQRPPPIPPPATPFGDTVAGAGMVEPANEASGTSAIAVGSQVSGVVTRLHVHIGQVVKAADLLIELDRRQADANLQAVQAALSLARANLRKLERQPRPEEVPPGEAQVRAAEATLRQAEDVVERDRHTGLGAVSEQDKVAHLQAARTALAQLELARANLALLKAGAWEPDLAIARANVEQAKAQVAQVQTALDLLLIRAPVDGTVLQVNVRPGEYVSTGLAQSLLLMGSLSPLHVRVNVDEEDLPRLRLYAPARALIRGDARQEAVPLRFVRLEPYVVPKVSLTGVNTERVDTRVVQLIYAIDPEHHLVHEKKILVGQLLDVFIDTSAAVPSDGGP
jgi:multidrug resistance efflux pump